MADYWAKVYIEILDDPKMATMPDRLWRRTIEIFLLAKKFNKDGHLPETKQLAWLLRMQTDDLDMDLRQIASTGIVQAEPGGWLVSKFAERQAASTDAERKRQQRDREHSQQYYGNVTELSRNVTQNTETETETETYTSEITSAFTKATNILPYDLKKWDEASQTLARAKVSLDDIKMAVDKLKGAEMSITGLWSVVKTAISIHAGSGHQMSRGMEELLERSAGQKEIETAERV